MRVTDKRAAVSSWVAQSFSKPKMAELIGGSLRQQIVRGELREGDALPSESTLMEQFGVSRPTLREAFRVLESESLITIKRGANGGAQVQIPDSALAARYTGLVLEYRGTRLSDVYAARTEIESSAARLAAEKRTVKDLKNLKRIFNEISATDDVAERIALHGRFDAAVVEASGNLSMTLVSQILRTILDKATLEAVLGSADKPQTKRAYEDAHRAHERLIELIETRQGANAEAHWRKHLNLAEKFVMSTGVSGKSVLDLL